MITLDALTNSHRPKKKVQRVGRGVGSKRGKTCCRGVKGDSARRGYKCRFGYEGGQLPLYRKLPVRGFTNGRFTSRVHAINLSLIEQLFQDGDVVNLETLRAKGYAPRTVAGGLKLLSSGTLRKKVIIETHALSDATKAKLDAAGISYRLLSLKATEKTGAI